jgi:hypothetical protein
MEETGYKLTPEEIESVKSAINTPLIMLHLGMPESAEERVHRLALAKGLPEIPGYYGADLRDGRILKP